jgi:multiple sugar transport system permease protein
MAFSDYRWMVPVTHGLAGFNGLANWVEMFQDATFWKSFWIAVKFSLLVTPLTLALSLFTAVLIAQVRNGVTAGIFRVIAYLPVILPISIAMLVWAKLFDFQFGYLNVLLQNLGITNPPNWLGSPSTALYAMVIPAVWSRFGSWTLLFLIGIYTINREIYEAAWVDGANGWRQFLHITVPLLKPVFTLVLVLGSGVVSATEESMILFGGTTGGPAEAALTTGVYLYRIAFIHGDMRMGYAATMSLFLGLVNMLVTVVVFQTLRSERA